MNPPIPTPKLVAKRVAHKDGWLEPVHNETQVIIEHTIPRGKRVDWRATAESLGRSLLDTRALYEAAEADVQKLRKDRDEVIREATNNYNLWGAADRQRIRARMALIYFATRWFWWFTSKAWRKEIEEILEPRT